MKNIFVCKRFLRSILCLVIMTTCSEPSNSSLAQKQTTTKVMSTYEANSLSGKNKTSVALINSLQISEYVRRIFQDSKGNLWFGTNNYGVCRYDGQALTYFSIEEGLSGTQVTGIIEDRQGNLWFATNGGVSKYDGSTFTNYTEADGLNHKWAWSILEDSKGAIWVGTVKGLCRYNGKSFTSFAFLYPIVDTLAVKLASSVIGCITEDRQGNLWFGVGQQGVCRYDGKTLRHITRKDGLCDNSIVAMLEDSQGVMWFGSMFGGLSRYDGQYFTNFNKSNGIGNNEVWTIYEDKKGDIWFSSEGFGVYRYNKHTKSLTNFYKKEGLKMRAVQAIFEDKEGRFWVGGGNGLYRYNGKTFFYMTKEGPWE